MNWNVLGYIIFYEHKYTNIVLLSSHLFQKYSSCGKFEK